MTHIQFDYSKALPFFQEHELTYLKDFVKVAHHNIHEQTGTGSDYLGWVDLPKQYDREEFARIKKVQIKLSQTLMSCLLSESAARILAHVRRLNF